MKTISPGMYLVVAVLVAGLGLYLWTAREPDDATVTISMPALSITAAAGQETFNAVCSACHGQNAVGSDAGPPLIHKIYEPSHHGDHTFRLAVKTGVRAHHWRFGNMPPIPDVSTEQIEMIIAFVRKVQRHNGIN